MPGTREFRIIVIISHDIEWQVVRTFHPNVELYTSPFGQWFVADVNVCGDSERVVFFHGGWGKIAAAASAQYVIDRWSPELLVNLGTCGGFEGQIEKGTIILAERVIVYDFVNRMGDNDRPIAYYTTDLDLSWLGDTYPQDVCRTSLISSDRDLLVEDIPRLKAQFGAVAGDWETGAIGWVAARNNTRCLILRGVTDLVGSSGGEAYDGNIHVWIEGTNEVMKRLVDHLPAWLAQVART